MCGIFGAINGQSVTNSLMAGLDNLSYRGYDSAGIAIIGQQGLERRRAEGKLVSLKRLLKISPLEGSIGIAHTRWATHGAATKSNAHPHMTEQVAVVHNGIIENYKMLHDLLEQDGYKFESDTDSETIPLLINQALDRGFNNQQAIQEAISALDGSFAIAAVFNDQPDKIFAARRGSPLVIGQADGGFYLASDASALSNKSNEICYLKDNELACISRSTLVITDDDGHNVTACMQLISTIEQQSISKQGYRHYMKKEIHEQPQVFENTIAHYLDTSGTKVRLPPHPLSYNRLQRLSIIACGTSLYAGMIGKYWLEDLASLPVNLDIASEYSYRNAPLHQDDVTLFISQSGETADTLSALRHSKNASQTCLSIVNVSNSSIAKESDGVLPTLAGIEIGVASTKAFTAQLAALLMLTINIARTKNTITAEKENGLLKQIQSLPKIMLAFLQDDHAIQRIATKLQHVNNMLYIGRGYGFPLALEGALKLKEISYIHAEAYPAGELKHGPIALVDDQMPVVVIAPPGALFNKTLSNLREVNSRGAKVILISNQTGITAAQDYIDDAIVMPEVDELLLPILYTLPLQLLAYHIAVLKGTDVDQPRNLAKSVTVE